MKMNNYIERLNYIAGRYELPQKLNYDSVLEFTKETGSLESIWGLCNKDLSNVDISEFDEKSMGRGQCIGLEGYHCVVY